MLVQVLDRLGCAIDRKIGWRGRRHRMETAEPHHFYVGAGRSLELNCDVHLEPQDVRVSHRAHEVDGKLWIGALEFHQPRPEPEGAERFGYSDADLAAHGGNSPAPRPHPTKG